MEILVHGDIGTWGYWYMEILVVHGDIGTWGFGACRRDFIANLFINIVGFVDVGRFSLIKNGNTAVSRSHATSY
jgi:hypothetical protein